MPAIVPHQFSFSPNFLLFISFFSISGAKGPTVLVSGATGRTGVLVYRQLRDAGASPLALVRNVTKASALLDCGLCGVAQGIYEGDVTIPAGLPVAAFRGAEVLIVATASSTMSILANGSYPRAATPRLVDYEGTVNQVKLALQTGVKRVLYVSASGTSKPGGGLDMKGDPPGYVMMHHLEAEAYIMNAVLSVKGASFTIVKPTALLDSARGLAHLMVFHDDGPHPCPSSANGTYCETVSRDDVAEVLVVAATTRSKESANTRFGLSSDSNAPLPPAGTDWTALFAAAGDVVGGTHLRVGTSAELVSQLVV